ncbi:uncharacterized protein DS421_17g593070 [Arachis hypogaea]|nr:uncharacterized protein DS421_17g593070 [Arachis hypogaea]
MKREWGLWAKLKGKETGLGWDPIKKTIQASDDWWDAKIQENSDVAKFREEGPKHLDEMEFLFEDVVATGVGAWAPSEDINDSYNDRYNDEDNGNEEEGLEDELNDESTLPSAMRQKRRKVGKGSRASQLSTQLEHGIRARTRIDVPARALGSLRGVDCKAHIGWGEERSMPYKGVDTSP